MSLGDLSAVRLLVVGDVMLDRYWFGDVSRISPEAPVPVVKVERCEERPGGAANVARNAAALGARVSLLALVGGDEPGTQLKRLMDEESVEASLHVDAAISTTVKLRVIGRQQQLLRIDFETSPSRDALLGKLSEFQRRLPEFDAVLLSDYGKGGLTHIAEMIRLARAAGKIVLVDPKGDDYSGYAGATVITPNRAELRDVVGRWKDEADLEARATVLRKQLDLSALLVTRSEEGMSLFRDEGTLHEKTVAREVYDVSGAGDTVIATLGVMLAHGADWERAIHVANLAAGVVAWSVVHDQREVTRPGGLDPGSHARGPEATGCGDAAARRPGRDSGPGHGATPSTGRPRASGRPRIRLAFCSAWPAAPLTRLSSAAITVVRPEWASTATCRWTLLEPSVAAVLGIRPGGRTCTNGSPS